MGADVVWLYCGVRFEVESDETEAIVTRKDARVIAARKAGLRSCYGRLTSDSKPFLLVGTELKSLGIEADGFYNASNEEIAEVFRKTKEALKSMGIEEPPMLIAQLEAEF